MAAALVLMIGLVLDGGLTLAARERALGEAQEAARAGAQAVNLAIYRQDGDLVLNPAQAAADADAYLASIGATGTATATGGPGHRHGHHRPAHADPVRRRAARGHRPRHRLRRARAGHRRAAPVRRAAALAWRLLRAAAGIAVIAALLAGLPWGLARLTGSPLPRTWPGWQQVQRFLASPLSDDAIIRFLADAAWLLWAVFALSLVIELIAVTRGQPAPRLPAIAPVQALAAALVGATMMTALHVPRAGTRSAPPLHAALTSATTISAPLVPGHTAQLAAASETAGRAASGDSAAQARPKVYRVQEDDDLWDIAQRFLGDPEEWHQIYQLNEGKPQPDGRALTDPNLIIPGWVLLIPQPASGHAPAPHPGRPGTRRPAAAGPRSRPPGPPGQPGRRPGPPSQPSRPRGHPRRPRARGRPPAAARRAAARTRPGSRYGCRPAP